MGFVGKVMDSVGGIQIYYIIGMLIFITLFLLILIRTIYMPKAELLEFKNSVFEKEEMKQFQE